MINESECLHNWSPKQISTQVDLQRVSPLAEPTGNTRVHRITVGLKVAAESSQNEMLAVSVSVKYALVVDSHVLVKTCLLSRGGGGGGGVKGIVWVF